MVWSKFQNHKDVVALQTHASTLMPPKTAQDRQKAELAGVVLDTLETSMQHLNYKEGQDAQALQAKNVILSSVINVEELRKLRLIAPMAKLMGTSTATIVKAGRRRADPASKAWVRWSR